MKSGILGVVWFFCVLTIGRMVRTFTSSKKYGPIEFFLTATAEDNIADCYGERRLEDFFNEEVGSIV